MTPQLVSKLPQAGTTIFTVMSQLAQEHGAVNLGQGFPDFSMPAALHQKVAQAMADGFNQYTHMNGLPDLRQALAVKAAGLYGAVLDPQTDITITPGATYAIYTALTAILHPGDEVIVFEPAYDSYIPNILTNGAVPVRISLEYPSYQIPWDKVREAITPRTRLIMVNSPHNPTGAVLSADDLTTLEAITNNTNILVLSDEVYEHLVFDGLAHASVLRSKALMERSFVCFSFGKTFHCTGWKMGYCMAPAALMKEFRKIHQFNAFTCDTPKQVALAAYLNESDAYLELGKEMQEKRDHLRSLLADTPFRCIPSHGSYFECYAYDGFSSAPDKELAITLTREAGVATIPVSAFYLDGTDHQVLRFCFAKKTATLEAAVEKLKTYFNR
ncbi:MAG: aminotransferase class I/II-fold pyridoxal phosphate-dependent enzyme [Sphingobacteriia bacterium]|nr:MAG: aminotransferase class I/II-fold pyridoxal phosphate-dependent enzyme [Sphingobacteriia bacterium]